MEDYQGHQEEGECGRVVAVCRGCLDPEGGEGKLVNASTIEQFRIIWLLSVEGKIFFSIAAHRMTEFLLANAYIDTSVQKGGVPSVPRCIKHTGVVTQLIQEAGEGKGDLAVLWLDLANAYGSIPHKLVETLLDQHHVSGKIRDISLDYYSCFSLRLTSGTITSAFHRLQKGIITGCTISLILFAVVMNMLCRAHEQISRGRMQRPTHQVRCVTAAYQSIHG